MKKLFNFTTFLSLISVQCSLAQVIPTTFTQITQVENRLEDRENRTAGTNQNTGYRLQGAECRKTASLLEYSSVPIFHLPSSISYFGVTPKLMMDPSSTEEEGIKAIEKILGTSEPSAVAAEGERIRASEGTYFLNPPEECATTNDQNSSNCACSSIPQLPSPTAVAVSPTSDLPPPTSIEPPILLDDLAENIGRRLLGKIVVEQALQDPLENNSCSSDVRWNAGKSHAEGNDFAWNALTEEERSVYNTAALAKNKAQSEAIQKEIEEAEQEAEKAHCRMGEAWLSSTRAARAVIAKTAKEKVEGMKTIEAERQRAVRWANYLQGKDRDFWKGLVDQHKVATDYEGKSLEISLAGKESEGGSWFLVGRSLQAKADYEVKASEAQEAGKTILAAGYREAVATSQHAADQWKISAEKHAIGEEDRGLRWSMVGSSFRDKAEYEVKANEAQEAGKTTLSAGYRQAASLSKSAANHWKLSVLTKIEGSEKEGEGDSLGHEGLCFKKQARYEANASEAEEAGKTNLAIGYREASKTLQDAVDEHQQAVIAYSKRKNNEGSLYNLAGNSLQAKADHQAKASEAQEAGKTILATSYREIATTYQRVTDQYQQSVKTYAEGKKGETTIWHSIGVCLQASADYQAKASDAQEVGNGLLAAGYREVIATSERAADQFKQAVLAEIGRKWDESRKLYDEGEATRNEAHAIAKRVEERAAAGLILPTG